MHRLKGISENVEADQLNIEKYVKELTDVVREMFMSTGSMFQQEGLRILSTLAMQGGGGYGANGGPQKTIMEHKVIQYLRAVNGDSPVQTVAPEVHHSAWTSPRKSRRDNPADGEGN